MYALHMLFLESCRLTIICSSSLQSCKRYVLPLRHVIAMYSICASFTLRTVDICARDIVHEKSYAVPC